MGRGGGGCRGGGGGGREGVRHMDLIRRSLWR